MLLPQKISPRLPYTCDGVDGEDKDNGRSNDE